MYWGGEIYTDSAAALGISQRAGIGKVRHLRTQGLWVQEVRVSGRLAYRKVLGTKNPADVLTKHVPGELLDRHVEAMGMSRSGGRAESAPELNSVESVVVSWTGPLREAGGEAEHGAGDTSAERARGVRFASRVEFRAVPHCNRGRSCKSTTKCRFPGGVATPGGSMPEQVSHQERILSVAADGPRPRWADMADSEDMVCACDFHGSGVIRPATMVPEHSGVEGIGNPLTVWQAIDGSMETRPRGVHSCSCSWRPHT